MRRLRDVMAACVIAVSAAPAAAHAQASLAGVVRDTSGAVLPGVTVEAASPALIEKVRTATTDGSGQYRIPILRPGTYSVTFSLESFSTVRRDGIQLSGEAVTTLNVELRVGSLDETITVTGEVPTIDVQTTSRQQVLSREDINLLPTGRNYSSLGQLLTGVTTNALDNGGAMGDTMSMLSIHGSRPGDQRVMQNGVNTMTLQAGGNIGIAVPNPGMAAEVTVDTSGVSAESTTGGIRINYIPRDGGNNFTGTTFFSFANSDMQADNLTPGLRAGGLTSVSRIRTIYDINPSLGGPIRRDRLWFYLTGRVNRADNYPADAYHNRNAYDPSKWTYEPDLSRPASNRSLWTDAQMRLTAQLTPKNKVAFTWDQQRRCSCPGGPPATAFAVSATTSPEAAANMRSPTQRLLHGEWSSPVSNRLLLEAVGLQRYEGWGFMPNSTAYTDAEVINSAQQQLLESGALVPVLDSATGRFYRASFLPLNINKTANYYLRAAATYVAGGHQIKVGVSDMTGYLEDNTFNFTPISYVTIPGAPFTIIRETTWSKQPKFARTDQRYDVGIFAQDRWTMNRLTINAGVRFDAYNASSPAQHVVGRTALTPNRADIDFPETDFSSWKDVTPRFGAVYDLKGDGKTALKVSLNKYLQGQTAGGQTDVNPVNRMINEATRLWFNGGDFTRTPDCDLTNPAPNGAFSPLSPFGVECGPLSNPLFGQNNPAATQYSANSQFGLGKRPYNWEFSAGVQRELLPRLSVDAGFFRRSYGNWTVTDNTALDASEYTTFTATAPVTASSALQGRTVTVYDASSNAQTLLVARSRDYGGQTERWSGVDVSVNARMRNGLMLFGGVSTGRTLVDNCDVMAEVPESLTRTVGGDTITFSPENCHFEQPFQTQVKANGSYRVPKADVLVSVTFQNIPGPVVRAEATVTERALGQPLRGANSSVQVPLIPEYFTASEVIGKEYGDRLNQVDLRFGRLFRFGRTRTTVNVDMYNLFNRSAVITENSRVEAYRRPLSIQLARYFKIGAQFDF